MSLRLLAYGAAIVLITAVNVCAQPGLLQYPDNPPRTSLITVSIPDPAGQVTVTGAPGAAPANVDVFLVSLNTGRFTKVKAGANGSFSGTVFAPPGTTLLLRTYSETRGPGAIVYVPSRTAPSGPDEVPFSGSGWTLHIFQSASNAPAWTIDGNLSSARLQPGQTLTLRGTLRIADSQIQAGSRIRTNLILTAERLTDLGGYGVSPQNLFSSIFMTPTNLPVENPEYPISGLRTNLTVDLQTQAGVATASIEMPLRLPSDFPNGYYLPVLLLTFDGLQFGPQSPDVVAVGGKFGRYMNSATDSIYLPVIKLGDAAPPRMFWSLLVDTLSDGVRGVRAIEDRQRYGIVPRVAINSDTFIVPRLNPATGVPYSYRLEPFLLQQAVGQSEFAANPPKVPFRLPSGSLTVRLQRPDGSVQTLGPAPFAEIRMKVPVGRGNAGLDEGGGYITHAYELSTMDPRFEVTFPQDGLYRITLEGSVEDIWGNSWSGGGTYEIYVARLLTLDTGVIPGTHFEQGDTFTPSVVVTPPVPANVTVRLQHLPNSDPQRAADRTVSGLANRFGYFQQRNGGIPLNDAGEYRVDITASYRDGEGNLWMGSRTWGGVVASKNLQIRVHGKRGTDAGGSLPASRSQWFFRSQTGIPTGDSHTFFPFNSGDVAWLQKSDSVVPTITFQDLIGTINPIMRTHGACCYSNDEANIGEILTGSGRPDGFHWAFDLSRIRLFSYAYASVERPLVRVREEINHGSGDGSPYWRFKDQYAMQTGAGPAGDLPNDFKFQYAAVVLRGPAVPQPQYDIYGSVFVLVPDDDSRGGTRVFPPFQGNGGGPSGGPLFTLKGRDIDAFLHLTSVRPGTVLEIGDTFSISGAVAPALPGVVSTTVTLPSGRVITQSGRANRIGYYYRPENDFLVEEPGIYSVEVRVTFDGTTSAGPLTAPFPTGDVLGSTNAKFFVYVVPRGSSLLTTSLPARTAFDKITTLDLNVGAPGGTTVTAGHVTTMMPGFILDSRTLSPSSGSLAYRYDPVSLSRDFPNLDTDFPADVVTVSLFASIVDSTGQPSYAARIIALDGPELFVPPAVPSTISYSFSGRSGTAVTTNTGSGAVTTGYGRVQPSTGSRTAGGFAIFTLRQGNVVVGEASVPATAPVQSGRLYAEIGNSVDTGIAFANPNAQAATISFFFTDANGTNFGSGATTVPAGGQVARFLSQAPFNGGSSMRGTFTFTSTQPVGAVALRGLTNERSRFLLTTLPVVSPTGASTGVAIIPHFADGGGWSTQVLLVNPTDESMSGVIQFTSPQGMLLNTVNYAISARSSYRFQTDGTSDQTQTGSIRIVPAASNTTPSALSVFSFRADGVTVSESGIRAEPASTAQRMYAEISGSIQSGIAITNPSNAAVQVTLELTSLSGTGVSLTATLTIPANGQAATFLNQVPGFDQVSSPFQGIVRVSTTSTAGVAVTGLRGRYNEAGDFLIASTPPVDETVPATQSELLFPHWADGAGYTTAFVLFNSGSASSSGNLRLISSSGLPVDVGLR